MTPETIKSEVRSIFKNRRFIYLLIFIAVMQISAVFLFPAWAGPDEASHYEAIRFFAENNEIPYVSLETLDEDLLYQGVYQPPFYYILLSPIFLLVSKLNFESILITLRLTSVLFSIISIIFAYLITKNILNDEKLIFLVVGLFALNPTRLIIGSVIGNSIAAYAFILATVYILIKAIQFSSKKLLFLGALLLGLGAIIKFTVLSAFLFFIYAIFKISKTKTEIAKNFIGGCLLLGIIILPVFIRNLIMYNEVIIKPAGHVAITTSTISYFLTHSFAGLWLQEYGTANVSLFHIPFILIMSLFALVAILGLIYNRELFLKHKYFAFYSIIILNWFQLIYYNLNGVFVDARLVIESLLFLLIFSVMAIQLLAKKVPVITNFVWSILIITALVDILIIIFHNPFLPYVPWPIP